MQNSSERSPKSYGVAVALCGLFGTLGIHHFYLEDWLHGVADLGLFVLMLVFFYQGHLGLAALTLLIDGLHTIIIFYYLIIEKWRDGQGRPVLI
jgi:TM2 domain-containing membrane protein YozV